MLGELQQHLNSLKGNRVDGQPASILLTLVISAAEFLKWRKVEEKAIEAEATADEALPATEPEESAVA